MRTKCFPHLAAVLLIALCAPGAAYAQYVWLNNNGVRQYSDMPPPASVPANRILKQPNGLLPSTPEAASAASSSKTLAEQNADFNKRRAEQAEKEKKAADETKLAAGKNRDCERARDYRRSLESGERVAHMDKNGERSILTDEQRSQELRETRQFLGDCK